MRPLLAIGGEADRDPKEGDALEFATAGVLLKLGVARIQRRVRLKVKSGLHVGTRLPHAEIDLRFTWGGRLWLVDCKDRMPADNLAEGLRRMLPPLSSEQEKLFDRIRKELSINQTKVMKEDLLTVRETGGLLGQVVCVRKSELPEEVVQYARHNHIDVVQKNDLVAGLLRLLLPGRPAESEQLTGLARQFFRSAHAI
jgi:type III secretion system FlhB-like substrate exporter